MHQLSPLVLFFPQSASLVLFLALAVASGAVFAPVGVSGAVPCISCRLWYYFCLDRPLWCCYSPQLSPLWCLPHPTSLGLFCTPAVSSGAVLPQKVSLVLFLTLLLPLVLYLTLAGVLCAISCPIYRLWCCFLPHLPPLVLFPAPSTASGAVSCPIYRLWCCFLPHLSPLVLLLT